MRIITGSARGINLLTLPGVETRPTAERTKEAVFSMIQFDIEGRKVLDLFAGSGQLALEALSRGASEAVLCDISKQASVIISKNAQKTRLADRCKIYTCEARKLISKLGDNKFDLVFLDPPYALNLIPAVLDDLIKYKRLKPTSIVVCETAAFQDVFADSLELALKYIIKKQSKYGAASITIIQPMESAL